MCTQKNWICNPMSTLRGCSLRKMLPYEIKGMFHWIGFWKVDGKHGHVKCYRKSFIVIILRRCPRWVWMGVGQSRCHSPSVGKPQHFPICYQLTEWSTDHSSTFMSTKSSLVAQDKHCVQTQYTHTIDGCNFVDSINYCNYCVPDGADFNENKWRTSYWRMKSNDYFVCWTFEMRTHHRSLKIHSNVCYSDSIKAIPFQVSKSL